MNWVLRFPPFITKATTSVLHFGGSFVCREASLNVEVNRIVPLSSREANPVRPSLGQLFYFRMRYIKLFKMIYYYYSLVFVYRWGISVYL